MKKLLVIVFLLSIIVVPIASAHPFTEKSIPSLSANAPVGTTEVIVYFSEPVDINFSEVKVYDSNGNQIDKRDTDYFEDEQSLVVTTSPMEQGIFTVSTKVLSKVDGHLVPSAFIFGVGDVVIDKSMYDSERPSELIFFPEAGSRYPGLVGQTIVLGAVIASLLIWGTQNKQLIREEIQKVEDFHHSKFMSITGIGLVLIFISDILMIAVQTIRLETSPINAIQTDFGNIWMLRMALTVILLGIWFALDRKKSLSRGGQIALLVITLLLIGTSSLIGHGAASGEIYAIILDYVHNFVASVWIGGIIYFAYILLPTFSKLKDTTREKMSLVMIPRFSIAFTIGLGIVIISGPTLMWFLESDVDVISRSVYGQLIFVKIAIASVMIGLGSIFQFKIQRDAEKEVSTGKFQVHRKLKRSLKADVVLGIALLGVVALISNGTLPAGEIQKADATQIVSGFKTIEFTDTSKFDIDIFPFSTGSNTITIRALDLNGNKINDLEEVKIKISNPSKNISPIEIPVEKITRDETIEKFQGEVTFGFSGEWVIEIEAQRNASANESKILNLLIKPRLTELQTDLIEYELPEDAKPLFPLFDGKNSIWLSDASAPKIWKFSLETKEFSSYTFDGLTTTFLTLDNDGNVWFTDTPRNQIGFLNPDTEEIKLKSIPKLNPLISENRPLFIQSDNDGNMWISIINKDRIVKYTPSEEQFDEIVLQGRENLPFALTLGNDGKIWFTATGTGKIGYIEPANNQYKVFESDIPLSGPEALLIDEKDNVWIAEHTGIAITKFNPYLETFEKITVPNAESLPFGMTFDKFGNVWFAQHTIDSIGAYDPDNKNLIEVDIPSETSFVQFMTSDDENNIWFVEQQANKLGMIKITEVPSVNQQIQETENVEIKYTEIVSPLISAGIIATSLFFVKSVRDKRRLNSIINS